MSVQMLFPDVPTPRSVVLLPLKSQLKVQMAQVVGLSGQREEGRWSESTPPFERDKDMSPPHQPEPKGPPQVPLAAGGR